MLVIRCLPYNASHTGETIKGRVVYVLQTGNSTEYPTSTILYGIYKAQETDALQNTRKYPIV